LVVDIEVGIEEDIVVVVGMKLLLLCMEQLRSVKWKEWMNKH
jgi:hypothetical protein